MFFLIFLNSCIFRNDTDEECYNLKIRNLSGELLEVTAYNSLNTSENVETIQSMQSGLSCNYCSPGFSGYVAGGCEIDSIKIIFPNGKGFLCGSANNSAYLFEGNQTPIGNSEKYENVGSNSFEFIITEEDYINAHVLP